MKQVINDGLWEVDLLHSRTHDDDDDDDASHYP